MATLPLGDDKRPITTILIFAAMDSEALPVVEHFKLSRDDGTLFPLSVPWIGYHGCYKDLNLNVIYPGKDPDFDADSETEPNNNKLESEAVPTSTRCQKPPELMLYCPDTPSQPSQQLSSHSSPSPVEELESPVMFSRFPIVATFISPSLPPSAKKHHHKHLLRLLLTFSTPTTPI
ncbi:unnamed protein product [Lactuca virosa]|uniref:Uncharacterized protein n=1 Tax=Lactuca virosa TaxID=75947 RepID=A0AAU9NW48_9ASTR|nr:unnamed protein product [Lactuca virosa]